MQEKLIDDLERMLLSDNGLLIAVRFGRNIHETLVDEISEILSEISKEYASRDSIPKHLASLLFDIPVVLGAASTYPKDEGQKIIEYSDRLSDLIREILS